MLARINRTSVFLSVLFFTIVFAAAWIPPERFESWLNTDARSRIVCAAAIILGAIAWGRRKSAGMRSSWPTLLLASITAFVTLYALADTSTGDRKTAALSEALRWIACLGAFVGAANLRGRFSAFQGLQVSLLAVAAVSLIGIATFSNQALIPAIAGLGDKQLLAALLAMFIPAAVAMILMGRGISRVFAAAALLVLAAGLLLTFNRTSWLSSFLGTILVIYLSRGSAVRPAWSSYLFSRRTVAALVLALAVCAFGIERSRFATYLSPTVALQSLQWRSRSALAALESSRSSPFVGNGPGSFGFELRSRGFLKIPASLALGGGLSAHAHNTYLETAADLGWPATAAYCALLLLLASNVVSGFQRSKSMRRRLVLAASLGSLAVFSVDSLTNPA